MVITLVLEGICGVGSRGRRRITSGVSRNNGYLRRGRPVAPWMRAIASVGQVDLDARSGKAAMQATPLSRECTRCHLDQQSGRRAAPWPADNDDDPNAEKWLRRSHGKGPRGRVRSRPSGRRPGTGANANARPGHEIKQGWPGVNQVERGWADFNRIAEASRLYHRQLQFQHVNHT